MPDLSFKEFNELCEANVDKKYVAECLDIIQNGECIYHLGFSMARDYTAQLYDLRLKIVKDQAKERGDNSEEAYNKDFEDCVSNLKASLSDEIGIASLNIDNWEHLIFFEPETKVVLGVLKGDVPWTIEYFENRFTEDIEKGREVFSERYSKGKFVRDWK